MKIPFKLEGKVLWISLLVLILFVSIFIIQNLYGFFSFNESKVAPVVTSNPNPIASSLKNPALEEKTSQPKKDAEEGNAKEQEQPEEQSIVKQEQGEGSTEVQPDESSNVGQQPTDEPEPINTLKSQLQKIRDPFQKFLKQEPETSQEQDVVVTQETYPVPQPASKKDVDFTDRSQVDQFDTDVIYQELYQSVKDATKETEPEVEAEMIAESVMYPTLILKGVVAQGGKKKVILAIDQYSYIVSVGEEVQGWQIQEIEQNRVRVTNQEQQSFILTLEGVSLDEDSN